MLRLIDLVAIVLYGLLYVAAQGILWLLTSRTSHAAVYGLFRIIGFIVGLPIWLTWKGIQWAR